MTTPTIKRFKNPMGSVGKTEYRLVGVARRESYDTVTISAQEKFISFSGTWGHRTTRDGAAAELRKWRKLVGR